MNNLRTTTLGQAKGLYSSHTVQKGELHSLAPSSPPQLSSHGIICTASDDSCGGGLGTRLGLQELQVTIAVVED